VVHNWADYYKNNLAKDVAVNGLNGQSREYDARAAEVRFLDRLQTELSGAHNPETGAQPQFPYNAVKAVLKENIGVKGSDPYAKDTVEPNWVNVVAKLGMDMQDVPLSMRPVAKYAAAQALPVAPQQSAPKGMGLS
jgi:hypothetical protein